MVKKVEHRFKKVSPIEHVLLRPEMYVGSMENHKVEAWMFTSFEPKRVVIPRLLPAGSLFDRAFADINDGLADLAYDFNDERGVDESIPDEISCTTLSVESNLVQEDKEREVASDDDPDFVAPYDFIDEAGMIGGVDNRLVVSGKADYCFPPGTLAVSTAYVNPGLLKIVDEILVNAADNRLSAGAPQEYIRVLFDIQSGEIIITNDGASIPIVKHKEYNIYIPELIFGHLLTSSHYDNDPNSTAAGRHGYGAKLTNILSTSFIVVCVCSNKKITCKWENNMNNHISSDVVDTSEPNSTTVRFTPEYERFMKHENDSELPEKFNIKLELHRNLMKRCLDMSASIGSGLKVYYNSLLLTPRTFSHYIRMHLPEGQIGIQPYYSYNKGCDFGVLCLKNSNDKYFRALPESLVNGIVTNNGTHLTHARVILDAALSKLTSQMKRKGIVVQMHTLRAHCVIFFNAIIPQPKFDSQSKEKLVSKHNFPTYNTDQIVKYLQTLPFFYEFCSTEVSRDFAELDKILLRKRGKSILSSIPKLVEPPNMEVPPRRSRTLIVTEGDSAKALVLNSLTREQRETFGVFPLRGKFINVRIKAQKMKTNKEVINLLLAMGMRTNEKYRDVNQLRYQRLVIMTDQDPDGIHIRGLLLNMFQFIWPDLLQANPGFVTFFSTPLIKARNPDTKRPEQFFSSKDYLRWQNNLQDNIRKKISIKYYKGLGTNTTEEGREYFLSIDDYLSKINCGDDADMTSISNAFGANAAWRRQWLKNKDWSADENECGLQKNLCMTEFVDKELIQFAAYDNFRMLPSALDGLKISQRKVLWAMRKKGSSQTQRVSQISGYVSELSQFHHGENSLQQVIINMSQDYVGSNNINWLLPDGQFGSRLTLGQDAAAPRYIFSKINSITQHFFPLEDDILLEHRLNDGELVEPVTYIPVVPTIFLNIFFGIGVGFAARGNLHKPLSVIAATKAMVEGGTVAEAAQLIVSGAEDFKGTVTDIPEAPGTSRIEGLVRFFVLPSTSKLKSEGLSSTIVCCHITEIPYVMSIEYYREFLVKTFGEKLVRLVDMSTSNHLDIKLYIKMETLMCAIKRLEGQSVIEALGLMGSFKNQYTCLDMESKVREYGISREAILKYHYEHRLTLYEKRLEVFKKKIADSILVYKSIAIFAELVNKKGAQLLKLTEIELNTELEKAGATKVDGGYTYLTNKSFLSLLETNIVAIKNKLMELEKESLRLKEKETPKTLWLKDLVTVESATKSFLQKRQVKLDKDIPKPSLNSKKQQRQQVNIQEFFLIGDLSADQLVSYVISSAKIHNDLELQLGQTHIHKIFAKDSQQRLFQRQREQMLNKKTNKILVKEKSRMERRRNQEKRMNLKKLREELLLKRRKRGNDGVGALQSSKKKMMENTSMEASSLSHSKSQRSIRRGNKKTLRVGKRVETTNAVEKVNTMLKKKSGGINLINAKKMENGKSTGSAANIASTQIAPQRTTNKKNVVKPNIFAKKTPLLNITVSAATKAMASELSMQRQGGEDDGERKALEKFKVNCSLTFTSYPIVCLTAYVPSFQQERHAPFVARNAWKTAITSVIALKRLKMNIGSSGQLRSDLVVASGHTEGRLLIWNADTMTTMNNTVLFNAVTVSQIFLTNTRIFTLVERGSNRNKESDDFDVCVYNMTEMDLCATLRGHTHRVTCLAVDPENEDHVLTGSEDTYIIEWNLPSQIPVAKYGGHKIGVTCLTFLFGRYFLSGGTDSIVMLWCSEVNPRPYTMLDPHVKPAVVQRRSSYLLGHNRKACSLLDHLLTKECVEVLEGHLGQVCFLEVMGADRIKGKVGTLGGTGTNLLDGLRGMDLVHKAAEQPVIKRVTFISACQGGLLRASSAEFSYTLPEGLRRSQLHELANKGISTKEFKVSSSLSVLWKVRSHRALITDVCWDLPFVASSSTVDGITFFHIEAMIIHKISVFDSGVRRLAIDPLRRLLLCGTDNGQLNVYSYDNFYKIYSNVGNINNPLAATATGELAILVASFQPHVSNITGILLERSTNGSWERIISVSSDKSIFTLDFDILRDTKLQSLIKGNANIKDQKNSTFSNKDLSVTASLPSVPLSQQFTRTIAPIAGCGSFLFPDDNRLHLWDINKLQRKVSEGKTFASLEPKEIKGPSGMIKNCILTLRFYPNISKAIAGCLDGTLRVWVIDQMLDVPSEFINRESDQFFNEVSVMEAFKEDTSSPVRTYTNPFDFTGILLEDKEIKHVEEIVEPPMAPKIIFANRCVSLLSEEIVGGVIAVALMRTGGTAAYRQGEVCLCDIRQEKQITNAFTLRYAATQVKLLGFREEQDAPTEGDMLELRLSGSKYVVLVQLRTGEIQMLLGGSDQVALLPGKNIVNEQFSYSPDLDLNGTLPMPHSFFASINTQFDPPGINILSIDNNCLRAHLAMMNSATNISTIFNMPMLDNPNGGASAHCIAVTCWTPMYGCAQLAAVGLVDGVVAIISEDILVGKERNTSYSLDKLQQYRIVDILHDGRIVNYIEEQTTGGVPVIGRARRALIRPLPQIGKRNGGSRCVCTCIAFSPCSRVLVLGYSDGVIQMYDAISRVLNRRVVSAINAITRSSPLPVLSISVFGKEGKVLSFTAETMFMHTIYNRYLREVKAEAVLSKKLSMMR